jgi:hypothetical protein
METHITINGREYSSVDEMPPEVRAEYQRVMKVLADRDGNNIPDIFEGKADSRAMPAENESPADVNVTTVSTSHYVVNGREYSRLEDVPAPLRKLLGDPAAAAKKSFGIEGPSCAPSARADGSDTGGFTIHVTWCTLFALLAAIAVVALIVLLIRGR